MSVTSGGGQKRVADGNLVAYNEIELINLAALWQKSNLSAQYLTISINNEA